MKTTTEQVKEMLLQGRHITKLDLFWESEINSSCLPQRIYDIRKEDGWDIRGKAVKGKGNLREYWLEPEEIIRIKGKECPVRMKSELTENGVKITQEQLGIGLIGGRNY